MEPPVRIDVAAIEPLSNAGEWRVTWRVHNDGAAPLGLEDAWVPHGRFRGVDGHVPLSVGVAPGGSATIEVAVASREAPGTVVRNAFLILRTPGERIFARMRVEFNAAAQPGPIIEQITAQSIQ